MHDKQQLGLPQVLFGCTPSFEQVGNSQQPLTGGLLHLPTFLQPDALHIGYHSHMKQQGS